MKLKLCKDGLDEKMKTLLINLKGWRTLILNVLLSILPILQLTELRGVIPVEYLPWYALVVAVLNIWMRALTSTSLGQK